jgi:predicted O-methyltransferase YrrM
VWNNPEEMKAKITEHGERYHAVMAARDKAGVLPDSINEMIRAFMPSRTVLTALELDVFTAIGHGGTGKDVAHKIEANPRATEMLLNALVSLQLLEKKEDTFFNTVLTSRFFVAGSPDDSRPGLMHTAHLWHRWSTLTECMRTGTRVEEQTQEPDWVTSFIAAMDRNARERAGAVVRAVGATDVKRMLDLGGGSGAYSIGFARALPQLRSEILDMAEVVPLTQDYITKAGLADRITARAGNMLTDPLGNNYDLILLSAICHMFSPEENRALFQRIYHALAAGGRLVVSDFILEPDKTALRAAALFSLNMLVGTRAGSSYSEPEYATWLRAAGFTGIRRVRLPGPSGLMISTRT